jgi:hypothetical protein
VPEIRSAHQLDLVRLAPGKELEEPEEPARPEVFPALLQQRRVRPGLPQQREPGRVASA